MSKDRVLHLIGNAHLDPVWLWHWSEGYEAARSTFQSALDRMDEEPEFIFTSSQAAVYQWIERGDPKLFAKIKARVQEGRWRIVGGWWMQPDCNIPSGESLVRQGLYGQRYFLEKLGTMATVGYNVDSFGHNNMIPQILKKSGMDCYVFTRPSRHENADIPGPLFWWESPDGSKVLAYQSPEGYSGFGDRMEPKLLRTIEWMDRYPELMLFYGVGNHGGGPTKETLAQIRKWKGDESLPEMRFSSPDQFFASALNRYKDLPTWRDELQHHASGCYSAHSEIKRNNRLLEHLLTTAEKFSVTALAHAGLEYPHEDLTRAWQGVLFNQFHDILAGTSIEEAYEDARDLHGFAHQIAEESITYAVGAIASRIDTRGDGLVFIVFNPLAWPRDDICECELNGFGTKVRLEDESGNPVPCQYIEPSAKLRAGCRTGICFPAKIGSLGYRLYRAFQDEDPTPNPLLVADSSLENEFIKVEIDAHTGQVAQLVDKKSDLKMLAGPGAANVIDDPSDTWSHNVFSFPDVIGQFGDAEIEVVETGPVRAVIRATSHYGESTLAQEYKLYAGKSWLACDCSVNWHEQHKLLKLAFPVNVHKPVVTYETPYGHIHRPSNGEEEPGLAWVDVDVSDDKHGLCLVNDSKYSYDAKGSTISLTVLRSPVYAHHLPRELDDRGYYRYIDQGISRFRYRLIPHLGSWQEALPHRAGSELNSPFVVVHQSEHAGSMPGNGSFITASAENVIISVIKQAEDGNGIAIRCFETHGYATPCSFSLAQPELKWDANFGPCEIKTFRVTEAGVIETDFLERPWTARDR